MTGDLLSGSVAATEQIIMLQEQLAKAEARIRRLEEIQAAHRNAVALVEAKFAAGLFYNEPMPLPSKDKS